MSGCGLWRDCWTERRWRSCAGNAALNPPLFSELYTTHAHASAEAIRAHLITKKGFNPEAANQFVSSFKATLALIESPPTPYEPRPQEGMQDVSRSPGSTEVIMGKTTASDSIGLLFFKVPFRGSELSVRIESGQNLTREHLARVRKYLELAEDDLTNGDGNAG